MSANSIFQRRPLLVATWLGILVGSAACQREKMDTSPSSELRGAATGERRMEQPIDTRPPQPAGAGEVSHRYWPKIESVDEPGAPIRLALLVGCTKYYHKHLHKFHDLEGPANDVALMRRLLVERFAFPPSHIVELSESAGPGHAPTRQHIQAAFEELAEIGRRYGKKVKIVVLLSGHGSQQPDQEVDWILDPEPDGRDEIFLPADIGRWDPKRRTVTNAIVDDELRRWAQAITSKGALLWVIIDACHSGTALRGDKEDEVARLVRPKDLGIPAEELMRAGHPMGPAVPDSETKIPEKEAKPWDEIGNDAAALVAIYAALPHEMEVERRPYDSGDLRRYGLLTYTVCSVLARASSPLTYRELVARVRHQYLQWGRRTGPTPLVEGPAQDRFILSAGARHQGIVLARRSSGQGWQVNAGRLHGLTRGTVLKVFPPPGAKDAQEPAGHVEVVDLQLFTAHVRPVSYGGLQVPKPDDLPDGGRCEVAFIDYGDLKTAVTVDRKAVPGAGKRSEGGDWSQRISELAHLVRDAAARPDAVFRWVEHLKDAKWVVQIRGGETVLVPAEAAGIVGPLPPDVPAIRLKREGLSVDLTTKLRRVAQAQNLVFLASALQDGGSSVAAPHADVHIDVRMLRLRDQSDRHGKPVVDRGSGIEFRDGEWVAWEITNKGRVEADVTLLFIDSHFGITPIIPCTYAADHRLRPGMKVRTVPARINARTSCGIEQVVLIAVETGKVPVDFTFLAQPELETVRGRQPWKRRSPLERLLLRACYAEGKSRGLDLAQPRTFQMKLLFWRVVPPENVYPPRRPKSSN